MQSGGIRVDGRKLLIVPAVSKEDAAKMKVNRVKVETGTRNLYLAREGCKSAHFILSSFTVSAPLMILIYSLSAKEVLFYPGLA